MKSPVQVLQTKCTFNANREMAGGKSCSGHCYKLIFIGSLNLSPWVPEGGPKADPEARTWVKVFYLGSDARRQKGGNREGRQGPEILDKRCINEQVRAVELNPTGTFQETAGNMPQNCPLRDRDTGELIHWPHPSLVEGPQGHSRLSKLSGEGRGRLRKVGGCQGGRLPGREAAGKLRGGSSIGWDTGREGNNLFSALCLIWCFSDSTCNVWNQQIWIWILTYTWILISLNIDWSVTHLSFWC